MAELKVLKLRNNDNHLEYATEQSACLDLVADIEDEMVIEPLKRLLISTGIAVELPLKSAGAVMPRSGLALKYGVTVLNAPGIIDADYRGEIKVCLINLGDQTFIVKPKMKIAQLMIMPIIRAEVKIVEDLNETKRGSGGFGSTGEFYKP